MVGRTGGSDRHLALPPGKGVNGMAKDFRGPSERANHRLLIISGALGGAIGLAMSLAVLSGHSGDDPHPSILTAPLPAWLAIVMAIAWGVALPVITWRWQRVVDEHERDAYRDGAVAGSWLMGMGAPVWWVLWRGGLAPAVDVLWLYAAFITITGLTWLWRKHH